MSKQESKHDAQQGSVQKTGSASETPGSKSNAASEISQKNLEANFSTLVLSIGSSAAMALGLAPNPMTGKTEKDKDLARFNIDLLRMLRDKTKGNLSADEQRFVESVVTDLQVKFVNS